MLNTLLAIKEHVRCNNLLICNILKDKNLNKLDHLSICTAFNNTESFINELINMYSVIKEKPKRQYTKRKQKQLTQITKDVITLRNKGHDYKQISEILNIPYKRVWSIVNTHKDLLKIKEQNNEI